MASNCETCGSVISPQQTFCRQCGTLTGVSGSEPTLLLRRPGPDAASPWARIGTRGDVVPMPSADRGKETARGVLDLPHTTVAQGQAVPQSSSRFVSPADSGNDLCGEKTRLVRSNAGVGNLCGWIVAITGDNAGQDWRIHPGKNQIGRGKEADIVLSEDSVSTIHAVIWVAPDGVVTLLDKDSTNGTFLNGEQVFVPVQINDSALIRIGEKMILQWVAFRPATPSPAF